jgi:hypothetical protein
MVWVSTPPPHTHSHRRSTDSVLGAAAAALQAPDNGDESSLPSTVLAGTGGLRTGTTVLCDGACVSIPPFAQPLLLLLLLLLLSPPSWPACHPFTHPPTHTPHRPTHPTLTSTDRGGTPYVVLESPVEVEPAKLRDLKDNSYWGQTVVLKRWTPASWFRSGSGVRAQAGRGGGEDAATAASPSFSSPDGGAAPTDVSSAGGSGDGACVRA